MVLINAPPGVVQLKIKYSFSWPCVYTTLQLYKGKYVRDHSRLEVQPTGRYFLNMMLGECVRLVGQRQHVQS